MKSSREIARATGVVGITTLASRILGLFRDMIVASYFGAGLATDAFYVAFRIPNLLRRLVAEGSLSTAFVPVFTHELSQSTDDARKAVGAVTAFTLLLTVTLTFLGVIYAEEITVLFAPGFGPGTEKTRLAAWLTQVMLPYVVLVSLLALASSILNSLGYFAWPSLSPAILNAAIIVCVLASPIFPTEPIYVLAFAVLVGGLFALIPQLCLLKKLNFAMHLSSPFRSRAVKQLCKLMLPSILSSSVYQLMIFINTLLASMCAEGSVTWLYYADRLFQFPLGIYSLAIATALLPALSRLAASGDFDGLGRQLVNMLAWVSYVTIPATAGLIIFSEAIVSTVYQHGRFSTLDAQATATAVMAFSIGLWPVSCQSVLVRAFLARKNSLLPSVTSCLSLVLNLLFAFLLMGPSVIVPDSQFASYLAFLQNKFAIFNFGHVGLALAGSLGAFISFFTLLAFRHVIVPNASLKTISVPVLKSLLASTAMCLVIKPIASLNCAPWLMLALGIPLGMATYFIASLLLSCEQSHQLCRMLKAVLPSRASS
ncbi:MAG: murein biosynthesis integral membrane protein MurJ [Deltaproteobacteria bacterium]|nr:murein biosynthesis integral membrane protein MurJ [Deltaproteobacteria bacterium]